MAEPPDKQPPAPGSTADVVRRLALWAQRAPQGFSRAEFQNEFARREVMRQLTALLNDRGIPVHTYELPQQASPEEVALSLRAFLRDVEPGVVSITGFSTAFGPEYSAQEGIYALNISREALAVPGVRQIWWMTPAFVDAFIHVAPDLDSWMMSRLNLTEQTENPSPVNFARDVPHAPAQRLEEARRRSDYHLERFRRLVQSEQFPTTLLAAYLRVLKPLAGVGAHDEACRQEAVLDFILSEHGKTVAHITRTPPQGRWLRREHTVLLNHLATYCFKVGRVKEAGGLFRRVLRVMKNDGEENQPGYAVNLGGLAAVCERTGRYGDAEALHLQALEVAERAGGRQHTGYGARLSELADFYSLVGRHSEAEASSKQALEIVRASFGENHPEYARGVNNLSCIYWRQGRYREAEGLVKRAAEINRAALGPHHPDTTTTEENYKRLLARIRSDTDGLAVAA